MQGPAAPFLIIQTVDVLAAAGRKAWRYTMYSPGFCYTQYQPIVYDFPRATGAQ